MSPENLPQAFVATLGEQVQVDLAQGRKKTVPVGHDVGVRVIAVGVADLESVVDEFGKRQRHREQSGVDMGHRVPLPADECHHLARVRPQGADHRLFAVLVCSEDAVRIVVHAGDEAGEFAWIRCQVAGGAFAGHRGFIPDVAGSYADRQGSPAC